MTERDFPFAPIGLVHIENRIEQHRPMRVGEPLDLRVRAAGARGGAVHAGHRGPRRRRAGVGGGYHAAPRRGSGRGEEDSRARRRPVEAGGGLGRRYAAVSGDRNPIHMHDLSAKLFGFPRAIAHGMWTKARCLAALEASCPAPTRWRSSSASHGCPPGSTSSAQASGSGCGAGTGCICWAASGSNPRDRRVFWPRVTAAQQFPPEAVRFRVPPGAAGVGEVACARVAAGEGACVLPTRPLGTRRMTALLTLGVVSAFLAMAPSAASRPSHADRLEARTILRLRTWRRRSVQGA